MEVERRDLTPASAPQATQRPHPVDSGIRTATWLQAWEDLGRAPRTLDAYARGLAEYLALFEREGVDPLAAGRAHVGCSFAS